MSHVLQLKGREQFVAAIGVLREMPGTWHSRGLMDAVELLVLDSHYKALVRAGVGGVVKKQRQPGAGKR